MRKGFEKNKTGARFVESLLHFTPGQRTDTHRATLVRQILDTKQVPTLRTRSVLTRFSPCDFFLYPELKSSLEGTHF